MYEVGSYPGGTQTTANHGRFLNGAPTGQHLSSIGHAMSAHRIRVDRMETRKWAPPQWRRCLLARSRRNIFGHFFDL
jgi:hypothetical protein